MVNNKLGIFNYKLVKFNNKIVKDLVIILK